MKSRPRYGVDLESASFSAVANMTVHDALGRRVTTTNAGGIERHVYDDSWQVIADADEDGNVIRSYVWGEGIDRLLAVKIGSRVYTALTDIQGTVWGYADESGDVVAKWTYDAWGNVLSEEVAESAAELREVRYRFQGRERSAATGLTNFRMRWYDAATGRWLSKDPIRLSGGMNLYGFCCGQPLRFRDLDGLCGVDSDIPYWERYFEYTSGLMIDPIVVLGSPFFGVMPKSWAPATGGRPPALGSNNPWTSIPRAFGLGKGYAKTFLRSPPYRITAGLVGGGILAAGVWNFGIAVGCLIGAAY